MIVRGFWDNLEKPIIGLAPMDGVTDAAFRYMVCKWSAPSLVMTEFTNVEGLARGAYQMLTAFLYSEIERPVVAQIYGVEVDSYYKCTVMLCAMGFDGVDINMGCPANKVAKRGSGAGLIKTPELAKKIVRACKKASKDWSEGISLEEAGVHPDIIKAIQGLEEGLPEVKNFRPSLLTRYSEIWDRASKMERRELPVSVKTRIGFEEDVAEEWTKHILETEPANISMHGRTLKQMYLGKADWDSIGRAARLCKGSGISFLGNGDIESMEEARARTEEYELDGVLVGRATFGAPWFFKDDMERSIEERFEALREHAEYFEDLDHLPFHVIKKHLAWYCKGFEGARELRRQLMDVYNYKEVEEILQNFKKEYGA